LGLVAIVNALGCCVHNPKRIIIVADIKYQSKKVFVDQIPKLAKGIVRLGCDVVIFSYCGAFLELSPLKSKTFFARIRQIMDVIGSTF